MKTQMTKLTAPLLALGLAVSTPLAGAQTPAFGPRTLPATECAHVAGEIARTDEARRAAVEEGDNAWKAIVPFVVLARKASSKAALDEADKKLAELKAQSLRQGCAGAAP